MTTHRAHRWESRVNAALGRGLARRGWRPEVVPITGYGASGPDGWVRVLARVLLMPPGSRRDVARRDARGWRRFLTTAARVSRSPCGSAATCTRVTSDLEGYVDLRVASDLAPGWARVSFVVERRGARRGAGARGRAGRPGWGWSATSTTR